MSAHRMASLESKTKEELIAIIRSMETLLRKFESKEEPTVKESNLSWKEIESVLNAIDGKPSAQQSNDGKAESDATTEEKKHDTTVENKREQTNTVAINTPKTHTHAIL